MELLIIAGGGGVATEPKTYERKEKAKTMGAPQIRKRDSKGSYFSIINDLRLTDKGDFKNYI